MTTTSENKLKIFGTAEPVFNEDKNTFSYRLTLNSKILMDDIARNDVSRLSIVDLKREDCKLSVISNDYPFSSFSNKYFSQANIFIFGQNLSEYFKIKELSESNTIPINFYLNPIEYEKEKFRLTLYDRDLPDNKYINCGLAWRSEHINLGSCKKSESNEHLYNVLINKKDLYGYVKTHFNENKNIYLNILNPNDKGFSPIIISNSKEIPDNTSIILKLNKSSILSLPITTEGNISFKLSEIKPEHIKEDKSNIFAFKDIEGNRNYIGKAWIRDNFIEYVNSFSKNNNLNKSNNESLSFKQGDFVEFKISNDYYLSKKFKKENEYYVFGAIDSINDNIATLKMAGSESFQKVDISLLKPATEEQFKNFEFTYNKIKQEITDNTVKKTKKSAQKLENKQEKDVSKHSKTSKPKNLSKDKNTLSDDINTL